MQAWKAFLEQQETSLGKATVDKWLRPLKIVHFDACNLYLEAKDSFHVLWFEEHARSRIQYELKNNNNRPVKVHISVAEDRANEGKKEKKEKESQPQPLRFESDPLDPLCTIENFIQASANEFSTKLIQELIHEETLGMLNPIYLHGPSGTGKTHLLMAIAHHFQKKVMYVRAETFTEHVVSAIRSGVMQAFRQAYRHVDLLLIDDIHVLARRNATQEELFHTFNTLHTMNKQIILSSNCPPALLQGIEERLVSRFEWGISLKFEKMNSDELRELLIQRSKLLEFPLSEELLSFFLETFTSSSKMLLKAFNALIIRSHREKGIIIDAVKAKDLLSDLIEEEKKTAITPQKIVRSVANYYGIPVEELCSKSKRQECAMPRQIAMYLCRTKLKMPYTKIGYTFERDHSTVMSSIKQVEQRLKDQESETNSAIPTILHQLEKQ